MKPLFDPRLMSIPRPVLAGLAVVGALLLWAQVRSPKVPVTVIAGLDTSRSVRHELPGGGTLLGRCRSTLTDLASRLHPGFDHVVVARVDRQTREFFDSTAPEGSEAFLQLLLDQTQHAPQTDSTRPAAFWTMAAKRAASPSEAPGAAVAIALMTDGDNDDFSEKAREEIRVAARALASNPRVVSVEIFGANPKNWQTLRELLAPLGARLRLHPLQDMAPDTLLNRLEAARQKSAAPITTSQN